MDSGFGSGTVHGGYASNFSKEDEVGAVGASANLFLADFDHDHLFNLL